MNGEHLLIDLGAGSKEDGEIPTSNPDYILQDIQPLPGIGLVCDIEDLDKHLRPGQVKEFRMSHVLEHFPTAKVVPILKMLYGLLEDKGKLELHVPNLKWHASLLLLDQDEQAMTYMFGGQKDEYDFHKTGYTAVIAYKALTDAGFRIDDVLVEQSIHVIASKHGEPQPQTI
jgi:predicted SAM-dependent methyltransferase